MHVVTQADREAARALRESLADVSGFWYRVDDDGPLCQALASHRLQGEQRLLRQAFPEAQVLPATLDPAPETPRRLRAPILPIVPAANLRYG